jgi:hypothetical protein
MLAHINPEEAALLKSKGGSGTINPNTGLPEFKKFWKQASASNIVGAVENPLQAIQDVVVEPVEQVVSNIANLPGSVENTVKQVAANPIAQIAIAYYMPGVVEAFAPSLGALGITGAAQTAVASAMASTALQVAQGVPFDQAFREAMVNSIISTGSAETAIKLIGLFENPAITNAVVSAGSSAAKTALNGGSQSDIERNLIGGLIGSGTATATGSNIAGSAAGGAVTGGVTGALQGAAGAYGAQAAADERAAKEKAAETKPPTTSSEFVSGTNLAAADTGTVSDAGGGLSVDVSGTPIFADSPRAANVKAPFGFAVMPIEMADKKPEGAYYDYTQNAWIAPVTDIEKFTTMSPLAPASASEGRTSVAPGVDLTQPTTISSGDSPTISSSYNPNIISTGGITSSAGGKTTISGGIPGTTSSNKGAISGSNQQLPQINVTGKRETPSLDTVNVTGKREDIPTLDTVNVRPGPDEEDIPSLDTVNVKATPDGVELPPVEDKTGKPVPYTPKIFTYGGVESTLPTSLKTKTPFYPVAATTAGLTSSRGAGEIESKETGKPRKNVWNEASLRLKDALGV